MRVVTLTSLRFALVAALLVAGLAGCSRQYFTIDSYPEGAVIFIDDEPRGQTKFEKLGVDFSGKKYVTVRVEKDGFQPGGGVLRKSSPKQMVFFLEESPKNETILEELRDLQRSLDRMAQRVEMLEFGRNDANE